MTGERQHSEAITTGTELILRISFSFIRELYHFTTIKSYVKNTAEMKQILLLPLGAFTHDNTRLTRDGEEQMRTAAEKLARYLNRTAPMLVCPTFEPGFQARTILAKALKITEEEELSCFEDFDFLLPGHRGDVRPIIDYLRTQQRRSVIPDTFVLIVPIDYFRDLYTAIAHLLWEHSARDIPHCRPGHFLAYIEAEMTAVLH